MARNCDPFRDLDRIFGEVARSTNAGMPLDLYRSGDHFVAELDLPGVEPSSIDIDIDDRTLTIRAERARRADEDAKWLVRERVSGTVARQLTLGHGIATDRISADYRDGVLSLTIPVAEEAKPRKIAVQHNDSAKQIDGEVAS